MSTYAAFDGITSTNTIRIQNNFIVDKNQQIGSKIISNAPEYVSAVEGFDIPPNQQLDYSVLRPVSDDSNTTRSVHHHMYDTAHMITSLARNGLYSPYLNIENPLNSLYDSTSVQTFYTVQSGVNND